MVSLHRVVRGGLISASLAILLAAFVFAQAPAKGGLSFDVAAVKTAAPFNPVEIIQTGKIPRVGMTVEGTRVDIGYLSLADMIPIAYSVKPFQVAGPDWLSSQRFDIAARMPEGATKEQVPEMLQVLLAERFQLKVHREKRDHSVYGLVVAKGGHKLKEAAPDAETPAAPDAQPASSNNPVTGPINLGNGTQVRVDPRGGGATVISAQNGNMRMTTTPDGQMRMEFTKVTMSQLADMLTRLVDKPVVDMTDLKGNYQATLDLALADLMNMARAGGINIPALAGARGGNPALPAQPSDPSGNAIFTSVQQLGLRLDSQKAPVDVIVVDHVEKTPTEN